MSIIDFINKYRKQFLVNQINNMDLPNFKKTETERKHLIFIGRVQGVGFRVEALGMAERLGLVGYVRNQENGDVEIEVEGNLNKINYIINYLSSIRRAPIKDLKVEDMSPIENENSFKII